MKKILLLQLPPAIEQALTEQLKTFAELEVISLEVMSAGAAPDIIVTGGQSEGAACPVLALSFAKPLRLGVLLGQIGRMLAEPMLYIGDIMIGEWLFKPQEKILTQKGGGNTALTDREVAILAYLAKYPGRAVSRDELLKNVWQYQEGLDTHTLETHIYRLRQKIEPVAEEPRLLLTAEGGYSLHLSGAGDMMKQ